MNFQNLIKALVRIVGKEHVVYRPEDLFVYEYDGSIDRGLPQVVVLPNSVVEVSRVVSLAYREGLPIVPRGAGTGLSGGSIVADQKGIQLVLSRMKSILKIDPIDQLALVEPGVVNLDLSETLRQHGLYYAPDPSSQKACTIGGNVAENAGGPHCLRYGVTTNHVMGLEVVLEDGTITWLGGKYQRSLGYDLVGAFVGSEGMFGVVTKILVRLLRIPETVKTFLAIFDQMDAASKAVAAVIGNGIIPAALEMMDNLAIRAVESARSMGYPEDAGAVLLIEVDGLREDVEEEGKDVERICWEMGALDVKVADDAEGRDRLWAGRKGALGALGALAPNYYLVDGVVPPSRLPEVLNKVAEISHRYDVPIANVFHAGDGNLHPCIVFDERDSGVLERVLKAGAEIMETCINHGGVLSGEHGIGLEKRQFMPLLFSEADMTAMKWLKEAFAPNGLFNPGKMFPGEFDPNTTKFAKTTPSVGTDAWI